MQPYPVGVPHNETVLDGEMVVDVEDLVGFSFFRGVRVFSVTRVLGFLGF
jgi:hypothetical protein